MTQQYGTGAMGDLLVLTGTSPTLSKDSYYNNVTIQGTGQLKLNGYRLFVSGTLTISSAGSVNDDGLTATGVAGAAALTTRGSIGGQSGYGGNGLSNTIANGAAGGGVVTSSLSSVATNIMPNGGAGGAALSSAQVGGAGGVATNPTGQSIWGAWDSARITTAVLFTGGGGGGGGSCSSSTLAVSGGGGSGGGAVAVYAKTVSNAGRISANGGGGAAAAGTNNAGGGGGGAGGWVILVTDTPVSQVGTVQATGGTGGASIGTSLPAVSGTSGATCIIGMGGS
jgi:hypothetical protein